MRTGENQASISRSVRFLGQEHGGTSLKIVTFHCLSTMGKELSIMSIEITPIGYAKAVLK